MSGTLLVLRAEAYRLLHARSTWLVVVFLAAVSALRVLAARAFEAAERAEALAAGRTPAAEIGGAGWAPFVEGWRAGLAAATVLLLIHAAGSLASDRANGVLRVASTRASTRTGLVLGRALLAPLLILVSFAATGLAAALTTALFYDFGALVEDGYELMSAGELRTELVYASLGVLPALFATYAFGLLVSAASRGATGAVGAALSLFLAFDVTKDVLGSARDWIFASFAPTPVGGSAMQEMIGLAHGFADAGFTEAQLRMNVIVPGPEALVMVALACLVLARRPL